jgi:hypothetical protein
VILQNLGSKGYEEKKEQVVDSIVERLQSYFPGLKDGILFRCNSLLCYKQVLVWPQCMAFECTCCVHLCQPAAYMYPHPAWLPRRLEPHIIVQTCREAGTPRTHRRFLGRADGSYGPIPSRRPLGMLGMPMNRTAIKVSLREQQQTCALVARRSTNTCRVLGTLMLTADGHSSVFDSEVADCL